MWKVMRIKLLSKYLTYLICRIPEQQFDSHNFSHTLGIRNHFSEDRA